jgi:hypothetical protein
MKFDLIIATIRIILLPRFFRAILLIPKSKDLTTGISLIENDNTEISRIKTIIGNVEMKFDLIIATIRIILLPRFFRAILLIPKSLFYLNNRQKSSPNA